MATSNPSPELSKGLNSKLATVDLQQVGLTVEQLSRAIGLYRYALSTQAEGGRLLVEKRNGDICEIGWKW